MWFARSAPGSCSGAFMVEQGARVLQARTSYACGHWFDRAWCEFQSKEGPDAKPIRRCWFVGHSPDSRLWVPGSFQWRHIRWRGRGRRYGWCGRIRSLPSGLFRRCSKYRRRRRHRRHSRDRRGRRGRERHADCQGRQRFRRNRRCQRSRGCGRRKRRARRWKGRPSPCWDQQFRRLTRDDCSRAK